MTSLGNTDPPPRPVPGDSQPMVKVLLCLWEKPSPRQPGSRCPPRPKAFPPAPGSSPRSSDAWPLPWRLPCWVSFSLEDPGPKPSSGDRDSRTDSCQNRATHWGREREERRGERCLLLAPCAPGSGPRAGREDACGGSLQRKRRPTPLLWAPPAKNVHPSRGPRSPTQAGSRTAQG